MPGDARANSLRFEHGETAVVAVRGEIDIATADDMRDRMLAAAGQPGCAVLIADLSEVDFFDASGVRALMAVRRRLASRGVRVVLGAPSAAVVRTLDVLDLACGFTVLPPSEVPFNADSALRR